MRKFDWPATQGDWEQLAAAIVKANLKVASMSYVDLERELTKLGVSDHHKLISARLARGKFPASFFLQALAVTGVENIELPERTTEN